MRRLSASLALFAMTSAASADVLNLGGNYGNEAGCRYLKTNEYGDESVVFLTSEGYQTFASGCDFVQATPVRDGSHILTMLCAEEGEGALSIQFGRIIKSPDGSDTYELYNQVGDLEHKLDRCP